MVGTITRETKREGPRKTKGRTICRNQKKGKELILLVVGSYFTHSPSNVICMQIMRSNSSGRFITNIIRQRNLLIYSKG
jgi:hypothetical protein